MIHFFDIAHFAVFRDKNMSASLAKTAGEGEGSAHECT